MYLGPTSRFGARYFRVLVETGEGQSEDAILTGLHHAGPLPSYNWIEVAETNETVAAPGGSVDLGSDGIEQVLSLLYDVIPPGGHVMVEYDSRQRADTAFALAHQVPAVATSLGQLLYRIGFGAKFKDWQIAEGGAEGPRKLQAYKPPSEEVARRWRAEAVAQLRAFLQLSESKLDAVAQARKRAETLLPSLLADGEA